MPTPVNNEARNTWLATEAAVLTTLHVSQVIDEFAPERTFYSAHDIEELNDMTYLEAATKGYPRSLLDINAVGMSLALQLGENTILENMLTESQAERFDRFTYMRDPNEVQKEYFGTYFSFATRLMKGYTQQLAGRGGENLTVEELAEVLQTDFIGAMIEESLATANQFWGIAPMESLTDMETKERELLMRLEIDSLYEIKPETEGQWPVMAYRPAVLEAARMFLTGNNSDPKSQRSAGCPMRFHKVPLNLSDNTDSDSFLSPSQIGAITQGGKTVGKLEGKMLTLIRRPIGELTLLFANSLQS